MSANREEKQATTEASTPTMHEQEQDILALREQLRVRLLPLIVLVFVVVSLSAPIAFFLLRLQELQGRSQQVGRQVARRIRLEARRQPRLWRYNSAKLLRHLRTVQQQAGVLRIEVVGRDGRRIERSVHRARRDRSHARRALWHETSIYVGQRRIGAVWVASSLERLRRDALLLLLAFFVVALCLAGLLYSVSMRAVSSASGRIRQLVTRLERAHEALSSLNLNLEREVHLRSSELSQAYEELRHKERHLRELSMRMLSIQESERREIARELHDSAGQAMTAICIHLQLMMQRIQEPDALRTMLAKTLSMTEQTLEEIRRAVMMLGPSVLDDFGLQVALKQACEDFAERAQVEMDARISSSLPSLATGLENACYRLVQEGLTNIARHAQAEHVTLAVQEEQDGQHLHLEIRDDGCGFVWSEESEHNTRGLRGMRERVELLGGTLSIESEPGQGTKLCATIPIAPVALVPTKHSTPTL